MAKKANYTTHTHTHTHTHTQGNLNLEIILDLLCVATRAY